MKWLRSVFRVHCTALLATALAQLLVTSAVRAECGDYVSTGRLNRGPLTNSLVTSVPHSQPIPVRQPCFGSNCQKRDSDPRVPPGLNINGVPEWLCLEAPQIVRSVDWHSFIT